ncbi:MAG: AbrB/MazE/SpoVT family DNA-binding domain-containing protein [Actinobacteria bacterium]|nr:AbrB/MazE/SpoVT family DNA-binding domain-containing protein [Actinomycetota bacterium]
MWATPTRTGGVHPNLLEAVMDTGIARKIDVLGRVVIPAETRRLFNINGGDQLIIGVEGDSILIRKLEATCTFCNSTKDVSTFKDKGICAVCRKAL